MKDRSELMRMHNEKKKVFIGMVFEGKTAEQICTEIEELKQKAIEKWPETEGWTFVTAFDHYVPNPEFKEETGLLERCDNNTRRNHLSQSLRQMCCCERAIFSVDWCMCSFTTFQHEFALYTNMPLIDMSEMYD